MAQVTQICSVEEHGRGALACLASDGSLWLMVIGQSEWRPLPAPPLPPDPPDPPGQK
jgi:hypothetical protein